MRSSAYAYSLCIGFSLSRAGRVPKQIYYENYAMLAYAIWVVVDCSQSEQKTNK